MSIFDDFRKNLSSVSKSSEKAMKKSGGILEIQKLKLQKASLESDLKDAYAQVGELYIEEKAEQDSVPSAEMTALFNRVEDCRKAISDIEHKITGLRGVVICPNCGAEADKDSLYCPKCGTKLEPQKEEQTEESAEEVIYETEQDGSTVSETEEAVYEDVTDTETAQEFAQEQEAQEESAQNAQGGSDAPQAEETAATSDAQGETAAPSDTQTQETAQTPDAGAGSDTPDDGQPQM